MIYIVKQEKPWIPRPLASYEIDTFKEQHWENPFGEHQNVHTTEQSKKD
jgi:hypothetical protein